MLTRDGAELWRGHLRDGSRGGERAPPEHSPGASPPPTCSQEATADALLTRTWLASRASQNKSRRRRAPPHAGGKQRTEFFAGRCARSTPGASPASRARRGARPCPGDPPRGDRHTQRQHICVPGRLFRRGDDARVPPRTAAGCAAEAPASLPAGPCQILAIRTHGSQQQTGARRPRSSVAREQAPLARPMHRALPPSVACRGSAAPAGVTAADEHAPGGPRGRCAKPGRRVAIADAAWPAAGCIHGTSAGRARLRLLMTSAGKQPLEGCAEMGARQGACS